VFWRIYEDFARLREWLSHRRTRAMKARLEALAERYAERTQAPLILITDEPDGYMIGRWQCDEDTAEVRLYLCWQSLLRERIHSEADRVMAQYMN